MDSAAEIAECIEVLVAMGFGEAEAERAVSTVGANVEAATNFLMEAPPQIPSSSSHQQNGSNQLNPIQMFMFEPGSAIDSQSSNSSVPQVPPISAQQIFLPSVLNASISSPSTSSAAPLTNKGSTLPSASAILRHARPSQQGQSQSQPQQSSAASASASAETTKQTKAILEAMGFDANSSEVAAKHFGANVDGALNWIMDGMPPSTLMQRMGAPVVAKPSSASTSAASSSNSVSASASSVFLDKTTSTCSSSTSSASSSGSSAEVELPFGLSLAQVESEHLVHKAVWMRDLDTLRAYSQAASALPLLLNLRDHRGHTPLMVAHRLGYEDVVNMLLEAGADPRVKNPKGWTVLHEASLQQQHSVVMNLYLHQLMLQNREWEASIPRLVASLQQMPDFYMEIRWEVRSWMPFVNSMVPPGDTFHIWKRGCKLRFDSHVRGGMLDAGSQSESGHMAFLFTSAESEQVFQNPLDQGGAEGQLPGGDAARSVFLVDFDDNSFQDALLRFRNPPFEMISREVSYMLGGTEVGKTEILCDRAHFARKNTLFGGQKMERIGENNEWDCALVDLNGLRFQIVKRAASSSSVSSAAAMPSFDDYFAPLSDADKKTKHDNDDLVAFDKEMDASLWLCEHFPLTRQDINTIMDIVSPASPDLARIKDIFALKDMPQGFPIKLEIPVMPSVTAAVTFTKYEAQQCDDDLFQIPPSFRQRM